MEPSTLNYVMAAAIVVLTGGVYLLQRHTDAEQRADDEAELAAASQRPTKAFQAAQAIASAATGMQGVSTTSTRKKPRGFKVSPVEGGGFAVTETKLSGGDGRVAVTKPPRRTKPTATKPVARSPKRQTKSATD